MHNAWFSWDLHNPSRDIHNQTTVSERVAVLNNKISEVEMAIKHSPKYSFVGTMPRKYLLKAREEYRQSQRKVSYVLKGQYITDWKLEALANLQNMYGIHKTCTTYHLPLNRRELPRLLDTEIQPDQWACHSLGWFWGSARRKCLVHTINQHIKEQTDTRMTLYPGLSVGIKPFTAVKLVCRRCTVVLRGKTKMSRR